jgi:predicted metal-dependent HD superfamily phosphohydrolase
VRHLAEAWLRTAARSGARDDVAGIGADLLGRWSEPHRRYHDLAHLDAVLRHVDELAAEAPAPDAVRLAAWFHDAVYDPSAPDNEERSAELAERALLRMRVPDDVLDEVARLVRLTATHQVEAGDGNAAVLCDADLAVLAGDEHAYGAYVAAVRAEYGHLDDDAFGAGRAQVLARLLERQPLFRTRGGAAWEAPARRNVAAELGRLRDGG